MGGDMAAVLVLEVAEATIASCKMLNEAIRERRDILTLNDARDIQKQIRQAMAWLHGASELLDPTFPLDAQQPRTHR
jgi:hypothetical protein